MEATLSYPSDLQENCYCSHFYIYTMQSIIFHIIYTNIYHMAFSNNCTFSLQIYDSKWLLSCSFVIFDIVKLTIWYLRNCIVRIGTYTVQLYLHILVVLRYEKFSKKDLRNSPVTIWEILQNCRECIGLTFFKSSHRKIQIQHTWLVNST